MSLASSGVTLWSVSSIRHSGSTKGLPRMRLEGGRRHRCILVRERKDLYIILNSVQKITLLSTLLGVLLPRTFLVVHHQERVRRLRNCFRSELTVVATGVVRVDGAIVIIALSPRERMHVEALLSHHAIRIFKISRITEEELQVALSR